MAKRRTRNKRIPPAQREFAWGIHNAQVLSTPVDPVIAPYTASCARRDPHEPHLWSATFEYPAWCRGVRHAHGWPKEAHGIAGILKHIEQLPPAMPLDHMVKKTKKRVSDT